jgi:hypothetical protein
MKAYFFLSVAGGGGAPGAVTVTQSAREKSVLESPLFNSLRRE